MTPATAENELISDISSFTHDPLEYVKYAFPWESGELENEAGPRDWQEDVLSDIGSHLQNPKTRHQPLQLVVSSGKGIGKSALVGMVTQWAMSTAEDCKVVITANTEPQLRTKTWPEVCKWFRLAMNSHWFDVRGESIMARDPKHRATWRTDRIAWSEHNAEAFAGLHNKGKRIVIIVDEGSAVADIIQETIEGCLTDEGTEIIWLVFGNPTKNTGRFKEYFGRLKHRWNTRQIDSRNVEGTNKEELQRQVEDYGEDSDHCRIWVRGEFPRAGSQQFIPQDIVAAARKYKAEGYERLPKVLAVDVARFGDDQTVIGWRQGRRSKILAKYRGLDGPEIAERVIKFKDEINPDAVVVDGVGLGASTVDHINFRKHGKDLFEFNGAQTAADQKKYFNRRAEIWGLMRDWLKAGAEIPDDPELEVDLTGVEYLYSPKQQIQLERKENMKNRGLASPDCADMLAMTFAVNVAPPKPKGKKKGMHPRDRDQAWMAA